MICKKCNHRRYRTESKEGGHAMVTGCPIKKIRFGYQSDYDAGKNMPNSCDDFKAEKWRDEVAK